MKIKALIVDDEPLARDRLKQAVLPLMDTEGDGATQDLDGDADRQMGRGHPPRPSGY